MCVGGYKHTAANVWVLEDNLQKLILSFHHVGSGELKSWAYDQHPYLLNHFVNINSLQQRLLPVICMPEQLKFIDLISINTGNKLYISLYQKKRII